MSELHKLDIGSCSVAVLAPRHLASDIRIGHKIGRSLYEMGLKTILVTRDPTAHEYLGMQVVLATTAHRGLLRPLLILPGLLKKALRLKADIYVLPNPDCLPLACALLLLGKSVIYDTSDDFLLRIELRQEIPKYLRRLLGVCIVALEWAVAKFSCAILVTQIDQVRRYGTRAHFIDNAPLVQGPVFDQVEPLMASVSRPKELTLIYAGALAKERYPELMLEVVSEINKSCPCRLLLIGQFSDDKLKDKCRQHPGWRFVEFDGQVTHAESLARIARSDIGIALLEDIADIPKTSITKLYEYMQFGVPFVASDFATWKASMGGAEAGIFMKPERADLIAREILALWTNKERYDAMAKSGAAFIRNGYNWNSRAAVLKGIVKRALPDLVEIIPVAQAGPIPAKSDTTGNRRMAE